MAYEDVDIVENSTKRELVVGRGHFYDLYKQDQLEGGSGLLNKRDLLLPGKLQDKVMNDRGYFVTDNSDAFWHRFFHSDVFREGYGEFEGFESFKKRKNDERSARVARGEQLEDIDPEELDQDLFRNFVENSSYGNIAHLVLNFAETKMLYIANRKNPDQFPGSVNNAFEDYKKWFKDYDPLFGGRVPEGADQDEKIVINRQRRELHNTLAAELEKNGYAPPRLGVALAQLMLISGGYSDFASARGDSLSRQMEAEREAKQKPDWWN